MCIRDRLLQVCRNLSEKGVRVLYISGEESLQQIKIRAERIGTFGDSLTLLCETNLDTIKTVIDREKPQIVVIDSIQTMFNEEVSSAPGSVSQVRESTGVLMQIAKGMGISIFIVGHVTKEGVVAGPRVLEHMVDTVLYFEGDRHAAYRILRGVKNRFGSTNEIGVFEMRQDGLVEVENPVSYTHLSGDSAYANMVLTYDAGILEFVSCNATYGGGGGSISVASDSFSVTLKAISAGKASISLSATDGVIYGTEEELDSMAVSYTHLPYLRKCEAWYYYGCIFHGWRVEPCIHHQRA